MRKVFYCEKSSDAAFRKEYVQRISELDYAEPNFVEFVKSKKDIDVKNELKVFFRIEADVEIEYKIDYTKKEEVVFKSDYYKGRVDTVTNTLHVTPQYESEDIKTKLTDFQTGSSHRKFVVIPQGKSFRVIQETYIDAAPVQMKFKEYEGKEETCVQQCADVAAHGGWEHFVDDITEALCSAVIDLKVENWDDLDFAAEKSAKNKFKDENPTSLKASFSTRLRSAV